MNTPQSTNTRKLTLAAGVLFLITFATSIPALALFQPVLDDPAGYIAGAGSDSRIYLGVTLELILIVANIGTALVLYPLLRRHSEVLSLGYIAARIVESVFIAAGIIAVLGVVSLRHDDPAAGSLAVSLAQFKDWTFLLGPGFVVGIGNGLMLGYLMYCSGLVPKRLAMLGLVGGPLLSVCGIAVIFDVFAPGGTAQSIATIPEFIWELSLGVILTVKGLRSPSETRDAAGSSIELQPTG